MARHPSWSDEYWLLLMQLYLRRPAGVKPLYARQLVELALELHIPPQYLYSQMFRLRKIDTPKLQQLWDTYSKSPKKLARAVRLLRGMSGFGQAGEFYEGVAVNESWERFFKPIGDGVEAAPVQLMMVLDLYFRLSPITMVPETPEVVELGKLIGMPVTEICHIMALYQCCDPCLRRPPLPEGKLAAACKELWQQYGNDNPEKLAALAAQMRNFFNS